MNRDVIKAFSLLMGLGPDKNHTTRQVSRGRDFIKEEGGTKMDSGRKRKEESERRENVAFIGAVTHV